MTPYSYTQVNGDGSNTIFSFSFPYLDKSHIHASVNGVAVLFNWLSETAISINPAPTGVVDIRRLTPKDISPVDFSNGSVLRESELDLMTTFNLYCAQEAYDAAEYATGIASLASAVAAEALALAQRGGGGTGGGTGGTGGPTTAALVSFAPAGTVAAKTVQKAVEELDSDVVALTAKVPKPSDANPRPLGLFASPGISALFARADHVHLAPENTGGGGDGEVIAISNGIMYAYKRSPAVPTDNPGDVTYDFTTAAITVPSGNEMAHGWLKTIPNGDDPLYVTVASASSNTGTDTVAGAEWTAPSLLVRNGNDGEPGVPGMNVATLYLYQRMVTPLAPNAPSTVCSYDFTTKTLTGADEGWSTTVPNRSGGKYLYVTTATAAAIGTTDTIPPTEWAEVQLLTADGEPGTPGSPGAPGAPGAPGSPGGSGSRGSVQIAYAISGASWSDSSAQAGLQSQGYYGAVNGDVVTLYNRNAGFSATRFYSFGSWLVLNAYLNGNMLIDGTLSASVIAGGTLNGVTVNFGSGHTPSGRAFELNNQGVLWTDNIFGGTGWFNNNYLPSANAVQGTTYGSVEGVAGFCNSANTSAGAHGVRGKNYRTGTSGLVGAANGYDFYADGTGVNMGPFTGSHDALIMPGSYTVGDIVVDVQCVSRAGISNTIFEVEPSSTPNQKAAMGVLSKVPAAMNWVPAAFVEEGDTPGDDVTKAEYAAAKAKYFLTVSNSVGEGQMNVCGEGGDIEAGDFIVTSSIRGKGMKQADDVMHDYTVAKAREAVKFKTPNEVKQVACIYLCG